MKPFSSIAAPVFAAVVFCFASCNDANDDSSSDATAADTTSTATAATTTPASTFVTTPQNMMVATHKVSDFDKWLASYDAHDSMRVANGLHSYVIGRSVKDPNTVLVSVRVDDMNKAKAFAKDASLKQAMKQGGVVGTPVFKFTVMTWQDTAQINTDMRSRASFTVKDWARWQHAFDSTRQSGYDNGLVVRAYGHEEGDDHKVIVVTAIVDSAKANTYWKSDMLKQRRAISGASEVTDRFIYRVAKKY